ncbi:MAG: OmpA family protein, partial [Alphaproteobacteria bacterium]|nr:OmpA family protein [Alphaproteobacteria bacterium]
AVELPGGNLLLPLYTEYVALANDLKVRKAALGMQPGIESEAILEGATSGLYDDVALGKTSGAYTSLARALSDPNGEDAKKWAAQKEATAKDKKTGMTLAAVGAIGSAVANIAINSGDDKKEKSDEINAKYDSMEKELNTLERDVNSNVSVVQACPSDTTGTGVPNCVCTDTSKDYKAETNSCQARATDEDVVTSAKTVVATENTNDPIKITPVILKGSAVFEIGKDVLREDAKTQLTAFVDSLKKYKKCSITITGYTDPVGKQENNIQLSQKRADAVKKHMDDVKVEGLDLTIVTHAKGEADCYCGLGKDVPDAQRKERDYVACKGKDDNTALTKNERYAPCRRIEMSAECFKESGGENQGLNLGDIASVVQGVSGGNQLSTAVNTLMSGTDDYKKLDHCKDDGYIKDYLKYIGYELHSDDIAVVKNFEDWCKKENGRLWAGRGYILPPWANFPSYFDAAGKGTFLVEYQCVMAKKTDMDFDRAMKKYDEMKSALGADRITNYFTMNCGANGYGERGNYVLIEVIKP